MATDDSDFNIPLHGAKSLYHSFEPDYGAIYGYDSTLDGNGDFLKLARASVCKGIEHLMLSDFLSPMLELIPKYQQLTTLSIHQVDDELSDHDFHALLAAIATLQHLESFDLFEAKMGGGHAFEKGKDLAQTLSQLPCFHALRFHETVEFLQGFLSRPVITNLQALSIKPVITAGPVSAAVAVAVGDYLRQLTKLVTLHLTGVEVPIESVSAVYDGLSSTLQHLHLNHCRLGAEGFAVIGSLWSRLPLLTSLSLSDDAIDFVGAKGLADGIVSMHALSKVIFSHIDGLQDEAVITVIFNALATLPALEIVSFNGCTITSGGVNAISHAAKTMTTLQVLDLNGSIHMGHAELKAIARLLPYRPLLKIKLSSKSRSGHNSLLADDHISLFNRLEGAIKSYFDKTPEAVQLAQSSLSPGQAHDAAQAVMKAIKGRWETAPTLVWHRSACWYTSS